MPFMYECIYHGLADFNTQKWVYLKLSCERHTDFYVGPLVGHRGHLQRSAQIFNPFPYVIEAVPRRSSCGAGRNSPAVVGKRETYSAVHPAEIYGNAVRAGMLDDVLAKLLRGLTAQKHGRAGAGHRRSPPSYRQMPFTFNGQTRGA
jgi:hypothetical protein